MHWVTFVSHDVSQFNSAIVISNNAYILMGSYSLNPKLQVSCFNYFILVIIVCMYSRSSDLTCFSDKTIKNWPWPCTHWGWSYDRCLRDVVVVIPGI